MISIITPSYNQGSYIEQTIKSVLFQGFADFEHIIVDGGSTDDTLKIIGKYRHLIVICEPDRGQADAVNKGLRVAKGDIIGWLNSDDTYYPGVFESVVRTIDPGRGVFIAMGRCAYIDETGRPTGREHPSEFYSHRRVVEIWKNYTIPQPAVFLHRSVYERCGGLDESLYFALDYDLFLRFTRVFTIYPVNELWATYRIHTASKTTEISQGDLLERSLCISRRYWGRPTTLSYWRYFGSFCLSGGRLGVASLKQVDKAVVNFQSGNRVAFVWHSVLSILLFAPTWVRHLVLPSLLPRLDSFRRRKNL